MKKTAIIFALILFYITQPVQSQSYNLEKFIGKGQLIEGRALLNDDKSLYGYFFLFRQMTNTFSSNPHYEYFVLDKNLNEVLTNSFDLHWNGKFCVYGMPRAEKSGKSIFLNDLTFGTHVTQVRVIRKIGLNDNSLSDYFLFSDQKFKKVDMANPQFCKTHKHPDICGSIMPLNSDFFNGILVFDLAYSSSEKINMKSKNLYVLDSDTSELWKLRYANNDSATTDRYIYDYLFRDTTLYIGYEDIKKHTFNEGIKSHKLISYNVKTGKENFCYFIQKSEDIIIYDYEMVKYSDTIYINGKYRHKNNGLPSSTSEHYGWIHIALNSRGEELSRNMISFQQVDSASTANNCQHLNFTKLNQVATYQFRNGTSAFILEKSAPEIIEKSPGAALFLILVDKNFKISHIYQIDEKNYPDLNTGFLFGQFLNNNSNLVFFIKNKGKSPETNRSTWLLSIIKLINGKYEYEEIPLGSKNEDFQIFPYIAKEGYILLREFNEKEKYDQLRLEKLNL